jgi:hypothetical protein
LVKIGNCKPRFEFETWLNIREDNIQQTAICILVLYCICEISERNVCFLPAVRDFSLIDGITFGTPVAFDAEAQIRHGIMGMYRGLLLSRDFAPYSGRCSCCTASVEVAIFL